MPISPPSTDILVEICARINVCVVRIEVVEDLGCGMDAFRCLANGGWSLHIWGVIFLLLVWKRDMLVVTTQ